jgi:ATP-dependent Clp protease ATP-binding subunit ClpA
MATPEGSVDDIFLPGGRLRLDCFNEAAFRALNEALRLARETHWDSVRSPHVFMGLLAVPDASVRNWSERLQADPSTLLDQFQELFQQPSEEEAVLILSREFLSDNVIRLLRDAYSRARDHGRSKITPVDLLISLFASPYSIVADCFARIGMRADKLIELAQMAEHTSRTEKN